MSHIAVFLYNQLFQTLPSPTVYQTGKTVIVTGSNVGLGKEAARHFVRLGAATVILAVRSLEKGNAAKADIENSLPACGTGVVQVWKLDMASYSSVQAFAARVERELERLDVCICNAGIATKTYQKVEENESTITVNVVSTFLLALLMLPKMKATAEKFDTRPMLTIVSSEVHAFTDFVDKDAPEGQIFNSLSDETKATMNDRYQLSKLLEIFGVREFAARHPHSSSFPVAVNCVNPGLCHSELSREGGWWVYLLKLVLARSTEYGSRTLVHAASQAGPESHGCYMSNCRITLPSLLVTSDPGKRVQARVWAELVKKLEAIRAGVTSDF